MLKTNQNPNTQELSSMKVSGGSIKTLVEIGSLEEFQNFISTINDEKIMVIGEGTNTIFINQNPDLVLLKLNMRGITPTPGGRGTEVEAGVNWDEFVQKYISLGGVGMEALSIIPGTVGAAPVQNIGAYGQEVSNFIQSVKVYDLKEKSFKTLSASDCEFSYRDSLFKREKNRFIILSVVFEIKKLKEGEGIQIPNYKDVLNYFNLNGKVTGTEDLWKTPTANDTENLKITVQDVREAIISIRNLKFPSVHDVPNCGSFFKNPEIEEVDFKKVKEIFPDIPVYKTQDPKIIKLPAGYILERLGFRNFNPGFTKGNFGFYKNHALMITSNGKGDVKEFLEFVKNVKKKVFETVGINLEEEVNLI